MKPIALTGFSDEISPRLDAQLEAMQEFGLSYLELRGADQINVSDLAGETLAQVKHKLHQAGMRVSALGSPIGKISIEEEFAPHLEKFTRTAHVAHTLWDGTPRPDGITMPCIRMFSFYLPKDRDPALYREQVLDRLGLLVEAAKREGVMLLHENEKGIYGDTAPRCLELMEAFYGSHFRAVFDFANFVEVGQDTAEAYRLLRPYIAYVHIKDALAGEKKIVPAGQGDGQVKLLLGKLLESGYRGFLSLEPHLVDFSGLSALELEAHQRDSAMDGKTAWRVALTALQDILGELSQGQEEITL